MSENDPSTPFDSPQTPPIHLTEFPADLEDPYFSKRNKAPDFNRAKSAPYSTSSPGHLFGTHVGQDHILGLVEGDTAEIAEVPVTNRVGERKEEPERIGRMESVNNIFRPLEEYIIKCFGSFECINSSFSTMPPSMTPRSASEGSKKSSTPQLEERQPRKDEVMSELDAKTLLIGDFAENGLWWTGDPSKIKNPGRSRTPRGELSSSRPVSLKSPHIDWFGLDEWFHLVTNASNAWQQKLETLAVPGSTLLLPNRSKYLDMDEIDAKMLEAQSHVQRVLLKATEGLLKRPGRPLREPAELRFLFIILANPLLYPSQTVPKVKEKSRTMVQSRDGRSSHRIDTSVQQSAVPSPSVSRAMPNTVRGTSGQHSGIIKRILGLISGTSNDCHHYLVSWLARFSHAQFQRLADLIGSFVTYRLTRQHGRKREVDVDPTAGLVPSLGGSGRSTSAALHAALGTTSQPPKKKIAKTKPVVYSEDWQIKAAARVMALLFAANNSGLSRRSEARTIQVMNTEHSAGLAARQRAQIHGQILPTSDFYNTLLDYSDLIADFEAWETRRAKFAFCQYPFFLSIWAKIQIMEHDAKRQMEVKAREAFFDSIMTHKNATQYLTLKVRRDCLVEDSLRGVSEVVGSNSEDIKKGLRIEFKGEEGIDAGGLRKEWFLLLVREVFNPEHGELSADSVSLKLKCSSH